MSLNKFKNIIENTNIFERYIWFSTISLAIWMVIKLTYIGGFTELFNYENWSLVIFFFKMSILTSVIIHTFFHKHVISKNPNFLQMKNDNLKIFIINVAIIFTVGVYGYFIERYVVVVFGVLEAVLWYVYLHKEMEPEDKRGTWRCLPHNGVEIGCMLVYSFIFMEEHTQRACLVVISIFAISLLIEPLYNIYLLRRVKAVS